MVYWQNGDNLNSISLCSAPVKAYWKALHEVADDNYDAKIQFTHPRALRDLAQSFNQMTDELSGIEMLRSDFINNFSHEFKTPIVSILGFAKILKKGNLTCKEYEEYLDIIIDESLRLTALSSNILNLSKIESMSVLQDFNTYNLTEQIRESVLLLENKWSPKNITFSFNMEEVQICANADLLKQVWNNLIDNAINNPLLKSGAVIKSQVIHFYNPLIIFR